MLQGPDHAIVPKFQHNDVNVHFSRVFWLYPFEGAESNDFRTTRLLRDGNMSKFYIIEYVSSRHQKVTFLALKQSSRSQVTDGTWGIIKQHRYTNLRSKLLYC
ncbi:hypothetical protein BH10PSE6_BH10PSE6_07780 [soil metagenome]